MKRFTSILTLLLAVATTTMAQPTEPNFDDPKYAMWGSTTEERKANLYTASFFKDAIDSRDYNGAAGYFQTLIAAVPEATPATFQRGLILYRHKIREAQKEKNLKLKKVMVDSLMLVHDLRLKYFSSHPQQGKVFILDAKARDFFNFNRNDRDGMREVFRTTIDESGNQIDLELVNIYFNNLIEDYKMDLVMSEDIVGEYKRLVPLFDNIAESKAELATQFDNLFVTSGIANCDDLESIFKSRLEAAPEDKVILEKAVNMMNRAGCSTPFYAEVAERYYRTNPTSSAALTLATIFQNDKDFVKASRYLRDALATESDMEAQERLYSRIALIELAASNNSAALDAAKSAVAVADGSLADNGIALFVIAQIYGSSAASCSGLDGNISYLAAYDAMEKAIKNFSEEEQSYQEHAKSLLAQYRAYFPSKEECFFNEIEVGSTTTVVCGIAAGVKTIIRTRD